MDSVDKLNDDDVKDGDHSRGAAVLSIAQNVKYQTNEKVLAIEISRIPSGKLQSVADDAQFP